MEESMENQRFNQLTVLMTEIGGKIDNLTTSSNSLRERIEEVNTNISRDLMQLQTRHTNDFQDLRVNVADVSNTVNDHHEELKEEIRSMKEKIHQQDQRIEGQEARLLAAQVQLTNSRKLQTFQSQRIFELEKATHSGLQHNRGWNIEIDGIPMNVGDNPAQLQGATIEILRAINIRCDPADIDTIHRLPSRTAEKPTIVRFGSRKLVRLIHENKRILRDLSSLNIDIPGLNAQSRIFIRASQCPYFKNLGYNCRQLKRNNLISDVVTLKDGRISIKTLGDENVKIVHERDLLERFPHFEFTFTRNVDN